MAKKKAAPKAEKKEEVKQDEVVEEIKEEVKQDEAIDIDKIKADAKKEALKEVMEKLGTSEAELDKIAAKKKADAKPKVMVSYTITCPVSINGKVYPLKGVAEKNIVEHLVAASGAKRQRLLREKMRSEHEIVQLASGAISSRVVKTEDAAGMEVRSN